MGIRIKPRGAIHIGQERKLVQHLVARPRFAGFDAGAPVGMPSIEHIPRGGRPGELEVQRLQYGLESTTNELAIKDDGLVESYGIFGAPGCGKTHLLMNLLHQVLQIACESPSQKYGGLILDPKSALIEDVERMVTSAGRESDLIVLNTERLNRLRAEDPSAGVNIIDVDMDAPELGQQLVMAAQASGAGTSDPFWMLAWGNLFGAALDLLKIDGEAVTLSRLLDETLGYDTSRGDRRRKIAVRAEWLRKELGTLASDNQRHDALIAMEAIENFEAQEGENKETVQAIIHAAYGNFQRSKYACYSTERSAARSLYESIIDDGKIVLVSFSPSEPTMARTLCTLVKNLFQRCVLGRERLWREGRIRNYERPLLIAADEYSQVACELQGKPLGDGDFFSQSRQFGCMGLLATQSVNMLQASSLKENWKAVFSNLGAKIFMRAADNETAEEAVKLAGKSEFNVTGEGVTRGKDGLSTSRQKELRERDNLPPMVLTQVVAKGEGVILGSLDGAAQSPTMRFVKVPRDYRQVSEEDRKGWEHE